MNINLHILKATGRLNPFIEQIETEFKNSVNQISKLMPISNIDVVVYDYPYMAIPELGIGAETISQYLVNIYIDPEFPELSTSIFKEFKGTLAHELHHALRIRTINSLQNLLGALIHEGLADHFDMEVNNTLPNLWDKALNEEDLKKIKKIAEEQYFNENYSYNDWVFGSVEKNIPRWAVYSLGFYLVEQYLKFHPNQKASKLYNVKAEEFIK